ncbi:hypothetical protein [Desulforhopalus sp. 52FAK]
MIIDQNHDIKCSTCHGGIDTAEQKDRAHQGLESHPSHPENIDKNCGGCHHNIAKIAPQSLHFTLSNSTNLFRTAFGAKDQLSSFIETPIARAPSTIVELGDDLLRRRCFKCHLYDSGQSYPSTSHGQGCAACHFTTGEVENKSHSFSTPTDDRCLSCHYGNYVGSDYYGRFEHDFNVEYRTPYTTTNEHFRPFGVEFRQLSSDIHQCKGLLCIDCHTGKELMLQGSKPSCAGCHDKERLKDSLPERTSLHDGTFILTSVSGTKHQIPTRNHPAHFNQNQQISCQGCHAQWSFDDRGKHYIRIDSDEFDSFSALTVQGNHEVESLLTNNLDFDNEERPITMTDNLTKESTTGIWLKGYVTRRWEEVRLGRDKAGTIQVVRPMLDYSLSWVDEDENVIFDAVQSKNRNTSVRTYTPHTTGSAGMFYQSRIQQFLAREQQSQINSAESPDTPLGN